MNSSSFREVLNTFVDPETPIAVDRQDAVFQVNGNLISLKVTAIDGEIKVSEDGIQFMDAKLWIIKRLANIFLLANRLKDLIPSSKYFVYPSGRYEPLLSIGADYSHVETDDVMRTVREAIESRSPLQTSIYYLTSDAGEGKTTVINQLAHEQAVRYAKGDASWLLVPIPLGGRQFMRFDDITVGALSNRYRFPNLHFRSFLELVKMGVLVPAYDGFEEMFYENTSGEALSAMGVLLESMQSQGVAIIAARKAYYDFENMGAQERLSESIHNVDVGFGKIQINRWERKQFVEYCEKRGLPGSAGIYSEIVNILGPGHALITRAVLAKRIVDVAVAQASTDDFLKKLRSSEADYFSTFVQGIIEREATEKWIDRSAENDVGSPLLTVEEHAQLLSIIAMAMWDSGKSYISTDNLEFYIDYYCQDRRKEPKIAIQIKKRIRNHALFISSTYCTSGIEFDHDEFRMYFLGEEIYRLLGKLDVKARTALISCFRKEIVPEFALESFLLATKRYERYSHVELAQYFAGLAGKEVATSYQHLNCTAFLAEILNDQAFDNFLISGLTFGSNSLCCKVYKGLVFRGCSFSQTSIESSKFESCRFEKCYFGKIIMPASISLSGLSLSECKVDCIEIKEKQLALWDPEQIWAKLQGAGVRVESERRLILSDALSDDVMDEELRYAKKLFRAFWRTTTISDDLIKVKFGAQTSIVLDNVIPPLLTARVLDEVTHQGGGQQRHFKLAIPAREINTAISKSVGSYAKFLENVSHHRS